MMGGCIIDGLIEGGRAALGGKEGAACVGCAPGGRLFALFAFALLLVLSMVSWRGGGRGLLFMLAAELALLGGEAAGVEGSVLHVLLLLLLGWCW